MIRDLIPEIEATTPIRIEHGIYELTIYEPDGRRILVAVNEDSRRVAERTCAGREAPELEQSETRQRAVAFLRKALRADRAGNKQRKPALSA